MTESAEKGNADAMNNLGWCYYFGRGVNRDYAVAAKFYLQAANQGNLKAKLNLGYCYQHGKGVARSSEEAKKWYKSASESEKKLKVWKVVSRNYICQ